MSAMAILARLPWRIIGPALGAVALLAVALHWHAGRVEAVKLAARAEQKAADGAAYREAARKAEAIQKAAVRAAVARQQAITERIDHDQARAAVDIDRLVAERLRAHAARQARAGGAGEGGADTLSPAARLNHEAYCEASGWLSFGRALNMARDAETDAAQARACSAWVTEQWQASQQNGEGTSDVQ